MAPYTTTAVTSVVYASGMRVFTRDVNGVVTEARNNTTEAQFAHLIADNNRAEVEKNVRSYYPGGSWPPFGTLQVAPYSHLAAGAWGFWGVSLFYQDEEGKLRERQLTNTKQWVVTDFEVDQKLLKGTDIAVLVSKWGKKAIVFFQVENGDIYYCTGTGEPLTFSISWNEAILITNAPKGTGIAAVSWDDLTQIRLYFLSTNNNLVEYTGTFEGDWKQNENLPNLPCNFLSSLAAVQWTSANKVQIRIYHQAEDGKILEWSYSAETGQWIHGNVIQDVLTDPKADIASVVRLKGSPKPVIFVLWSTENAVLHQRVATSWGWLDIDSATIPRTYI